MKEEPSSRPALFGKGPVLITGGAGFLGRYLAARLDGSGCGVTVLDDLSCVNSTFACPQLAPDRISKVKGSVFDRSLVNRLVAEHRFVVHFASVVGVEETMSRTVPTIENLDGTLNVVRALTADHIVVFGSSADVYGAHSRLYDRPMREDDYCAFENARVNRWVYSHVKTLEENLISNSAARSVVVRIFNCYGPDMDFPAPKRVIPHFIDCVLGGRPLLLSGDGSQRRSFCFIDDMIEGLIKVLAYAANGESCPGDCFNLGYPEPVTIQALADLVNESALSLSILDRALPVVADTFSYARAFDDTWHRTPDISRARQMLGFVPDVRLREGLERTLIHYHPTQRDGVRSLGGAPSR